MSPLLLLSLLESSYFSLSSPVLRISESFGPVDKSGFLCKRTSLLFEVERLAFPVAASVSPANCRRFPAPRAEAERRRVGSVSHAFTTHARCVAHGATATGGAAGVQGLLPS